MWRPIETAPKDGTKIDVWVRAFVVGTAGKVAVEDIGRRADVWWGVEQHTYVNPYDRREGEEGWVYPDGMHHELVESGSRRVTHWMPLPEPPAA